MLNAMPHPPRAIVNEVVQNLSLEGHFSITDAYLQIYYSGNTVCISVTTPKGGSSELVECFDLLLMVKL